jgi:four-jointed box protein 1
MDNIAPISVLQVNSSDGRWKADELRQINWSTGDYVSISKWIDGFEPADVMPRLLQASYNSGIPLSFHNMSCPQNFVKTDNSSLPLTSEELVDLFQWSDMIIFDYLTGNYDRSVRCYYNKRTTTFVA